MNTTTPTDHPEILKQLYASGRCRPGFVVSNLGAATGTSPELATLAAASLLGGIAGPETAILGSADNPISPAFNLIVVGHDDAGWQRLQRLLLAPIESLQSRLREMSRAVKPDRLLAAADGRGFKDETAVLFSAVGREFNDDLPSTLTQNLRASRALRLPSVLLTSPDPDTFIKGIAEILDRQVSLVYPTGRLFEELGRMSPSRAWLDLLGKIVNALDGHDDHFDKIHPNEGYGRLAIFKATLMMTCSHSQVVQAMGGTNPDVQRLMQQILVVRPSFRQPDPISDREQLRGGFGRYTHVAGEMLSSRRGREGFQFKVKKPDYELLMEYTSYLQSTLPRLVGVPNCDWVLDLPWKLAWTMMSLEGLKTGDCCVPYAIHVANCVIGEHATFSREEGRKLKLQAEESARRVLLGKLEKLGPCTFRELSRTFRIQRKAIYEPVLEGLVSDGLVVLKENCYTLTNQPGPKEGA